MGGKRWGTRVSGDSGTKTEAGKRPYLELHQKLLVAVVLFVIAAFVQAFNCFDLSAQHDEAAAELSSLVRAPFAANRGAAATAAPVTVLLVDDGVRRDLGFDTAYLPYDKLAQTLKAIIAAKPKAIFLDYAYQRSTTEDARPPQGGGKSGLQQLIDVLPDKGKGVPIYAGPIGDSGDLANLRKKISTVGISWHAEHRLDYPFDGNSDFTRGESDAVATAAPAIYRNLCIKPDAGIDCSGRQAIDGMFSGNVVRLDKAPPAMFLNYLPYTGEGLYRQSDACKGEPRGDAFARQAWARTVLRTINGDDTRGPSKCIDVPHFSLSDVMTPDFDGAGFNVLPDYAKAYITGKVVMIGDSSGTDRFDAPVFGRMDGVFQHAIALQTLMRDGSRYTRWADGPAVDHKGRESARLPWNFLLESLISFCVLAAILVADRPAPESGAPKGGARTGEVARRTRLIIFVLALGGATAAIEARNHWPLANLLNIAGGVLGVLAITELDKIISRRWPVLVATLVAGALVLGGGYALLRSWV